jgi:hypothetical protein
LLELRSEAMGARVTIVSVAGAPPVPGVTLVGATLQVLTGGAPEQARETEPVNGPLTPAIVTG